MLILLTWLRGDFIGKKYLPAFPFLAAVFVLTPGLSMIPLIPTALHLTAIILGVKVGDQQPIADNVTIARSLGSTYSKAGVLAGLMTVAAIFSSVLFISASKKSLSEFAEQNSGIPIKNLPAKLKSPLPIAAPALEKVVVESPAVPEKFDIPPTPHIDSAKHSVSNMVKRKHVQKMALISDQNATKDVGEVRYININE